MAIGDRIREKRIAKGWTEADFKAAAERRQKLKNGFKIISNLIPVPGVSEAADLATGIADSIKENKDAPAGKKIRAVLSANSDELAEVIQVAVNDENIPDFDERVASLLQDPITHLAMQGTKELLDRLEERIGDLPDDVEELILDAVLDLVEDAMEELEQQIKGAGVSILKRLVEWVKSLF